jgi:hypothetical protein
MRHPNSLIPESTHFSSPPCLLHSIHFAVGLSTASSVVLQQWCHLLHVSSPAVQIVSVFIPSHPLSFYDINIGWNTLGFTIASEGCFKFLSRDSLIFSTEWSVECLLIPSMLIPVKTAASVHTIYIFKYLFVLVHSKFSAFLAYPTFQNQVVVSSGNACDLF